MGGEDTGGGRGLGRGSPGPQLPGGVAEATARGVVDRLFRQESGRAVATLIRVLGDFDLAEEAVQDAFAVALERWPTLGMPDNPAAWITTTARNRAIDRLRRDRRLAERTETLRRLAALEAMGEPVSDSAIPDERLRLIFTCCHPALAIDAQVALTLRALRVGRPGPYQLQAAIAALHGAAGRPEDTDWRQISLLYARLAEIRPTPVVELNRAAAVAMAEGPERGLELMAPLAPALEHYHLFHAARADLLRRLGRHDESAAAYRRALALVSNDVELEDLPDHGQAEARPPGSAGVGIATPEEPVAQVAQLLPRNPRPVVAHDDLHRVAAAVGGDPDRGAVGGVFDRVRQEVLHDALQEERVRRGEDAVFDLDAGRVGLEEGAQPLHDPLHERL